MLLNLTDISDESLQNQIVRQVRAKILAGELHRGSDLPSIRSLAREQRISVITVQRAYENLEREGLIHSRRGKGFFVSDLSQEKKQTMAQDSLEEKLRPLLNTALAEGLVKEDILRIVSAVLHNSLPSHNDRGE